MKHITVSGDHIENIIFIYFAAIGKKNTKSRCTSSSGWELNLGTNTAYHSWRNNTKLLHILDYTYLHFNDSLVLVNESQRFVIIFIEGNCFNFIKASLALQLLCQEEQCR